MRHNDAQLLDMLPYIRATKEVHCTNFRIPVNCLYEQRFNLKQTKLSCCIHCPLVTHLDATHLSLNCV